MADLIAEIRLTNFNFPVEDGVGLFLFSLKFAGYERGGGRGGGGVKRRVI
jgi:hypothetical protein